MNTIAPQPSQNAQTADNVTAHQKQSLSLEPQLINSGQFNSAAGLVTR